MFPLTCKNINSYKRIVSEIIFWSGWSEDNEFYYDMYYVNIILESDLHYTAPFDFDMSIYYPKYEQKILDMFSDYSMEQIFDAVSYFIYEYRMVLEEERSEVIPKNPVSGWFQTLGKNMEDSIKIVLSKIYGYCIDTIGKGEYNIPGTDINLVGRADGYIATSPGGIYDDHVLECKYSSGKSNVKKIQVQISCYYKIYNKPVLLAVFQHNSIRVYRYSGYTLEKIWSDSVLPALSESCEDIRKKMKVDRISMVPEMVRMLSE